MPIDACRSPSFLYIGAPKSGSTWIYHALHGHPDVFIPPARNLSFFDQHYDRGWDWYLRHFRKAPAGAVLGEVSHDYYFSEAAARRIRAHLPRVRLICCLREPGAFAVSILQWWHHHTRRYGSTFAEMAAHPEFCRLTAYRRNLQVYFDLFPRDQILVMFYEQLRADPRSFIGQLYDFIGVDPDYRPQSVAERSNPTLPPRNRSVMIAVCDAAQLVRRLGGDRFIDAVRWGPAFDRHLYRLFYTSRGALDDPTRMAELERIAERVRAEAAGEYEALARLIRKPLPPEWLTRGGGRG